MKSYIFCFLFLAFSLHLFSQDDGWNNRVIDTYANNEEVARVSLKFIAGFTTNGHPKFLGYIDPLLPPGGGTQVTDGEFNMNYVRTFIPIGNNETENIPVHESVDYDKWSENITYFDGLGREVQYVAVSASAAGYDIVQPIIYDNAGRIIEEYMPYTINQTGPSGPGGYRTVPLPEQSGFHSVYYGDNNGQYAYSKTEYDNSPLNRVMKKSAPGENYRLETGHVLEFGYQSNGSNEVVYFKIDGSNLVKDGYYLSNELYKNVSIDENDNEIIEYKNKSGQVLLKEAEAGTKTYYVYDDYGLLRYVLPPEASVLYESGTPTSQELELYCFYYEYDVLGRMIVKRIPGAEPVYMVYNKLDQLVLSQDGNQRADNQYLWTFIKYDVFNRPVITGEHYAGSAKTQSQMQNDVDAVTSYYETYTTGTGYSNVSYPIIDNDDNVYSVSYFDSYDAISLYDNTGKYDFKNSEIEFMHLENNAESSKTKGIPTVTLTKILLNPGETVTDDEHLSVVYYNEYGQVIQVISDNHLGGVNVVSSKVNFTGDILETREKQIDASNTYNLYSRFEYDRAKRITKAEHKIQDQNWVTLSHNYYDEPGLLRIKMLHGNIQRVDYNYNIRGWLTDINDVSNMGSDYFAMSLAFDNAQTNPQYNGNIGSISWKSFNFDQEKTYEFTYDGLNRLTGAVYADNDMFSTSYSYDKNGNLETLNRKMNIGGTAYQVDQLDYEYTGNRLKKVDDNITNTNYEYGFTDNGIFLDTEYQYDNNGNMILDKNKNICQIEYNHLNLPVYVGINQSQSNKINYVYSADGIKLRKLTTSNGVPQTKTDYSGSFVYENDQLLYILTSEGRIVPDLSGEFSYEYALRDHLGNTRIMFTEKGEVIQDQSYYPFGMSMGDALTTNNTDNSPENHYLYNGKELQDDFGLDWYDYGARFYDAQLGRWHVIDPMYERHYDWTPYAYVLNNPIINIDLYGFTDWKAIMKGSAMVVGGLASVIGGVAAASTPTGIGQYAGGAAIVTGVPTMGVGIGMIAAGIKDDGTAQKVPTGPGETAGMVGDKLMGNENNELRNAGSAVDLGVNISTANPQTAIEGVAWSVDITISVDNIVNNENSSTDANTISEQTTQSDSKSKDANGIDLVLGQHLKNSDPDYWNSLTNEQKTGYNQDRVDSYQQYLLDDNK